MAASIPQMRRTLGRRRIFGERQTLLAFLTPNPVGGSCCNRAAVLARELLEDVRLAAARRKPRRTAS